MNKVALCFMTKDRVELSRRTIEPLLNCGADIWWMDGSSTPEGEELPHGYEKMIHAVRHNVRGGPDAAVAYAVTECLKHDYDFIGIVENDVLLQPGWFERTMALAGQAEADGLKVGAISARCYEDRVLFQRDGYSACHNTGFGTVIWTREAATLMLKHLRTSFTTENRRVFMQLAGIDIGHHWAFRLGEHWLCADWGVDRVLAAHGLASVALDPSPVEMIGQTPSLAEQGLTLATGRKLPDHGGDFNQFVERQAAIRADRLKLPESPFVYQHGRGGWMIFAHQAHALPDFTCSDAWRLKWIQGYGPFGYESVDPGAKVTMTISGPCGVMASGGEKGAQVRVRDLVSGYECEPMLPPPNVHQSPIMSLLVPGNIASRTIEFEALEPGAVFHGLVCEEPQPFDPGFTFDHSVLPPV